MTLHYSFNKNYEFEKETTGPTSHEQLEEMLKQCVSLGWIANNGLSFVYIKTIGDQEGLIFKNMLDGSCLTMDYHWLFSKDSGIMEFVEWKWTDLASDLDSMLDRSDGYYYWSSKCHTVKELHEMIMAKMTAEEKIQYFVNNAIIPSTVSE